MPATYATAADLRALVPDSFRDEALADTLGGTEADPGLLAAVLATASREVDALIEGRVALPLAEPVPAKLRLAAAHLALETLYIRRGLDLPDSLAGKVGWWRTWLSKIGEGDLRLADGGGAAETPRESRAAIAARPAVTGSGRILG